VSAAASAAASAAVLAPRARTVVEVTAPTGEAWRYGYDDAGNLITVEEPNGLRTRAELNVLGAPFTIELPGSTVRYVYDPSGRLQAMHDELGRQAVRQTEGSNHVHLYLKTRELLRRDEEGALSAEYVAVLVIVAAIVAVIIALNLPETVDGAGKEAVDGMFG
jgi:YD repeat-containing protein